MIAVAALAILYWLGANVLVGTDLLLGVLNTTPADLKVAYADAYTIFPGRVTVSDFALRFQDRNVQMLLRLDRATLQIDLAALARRTFHVTSLHGEGAALRVRHKDDGTGRERRLSALPPIEGYLDPPLREPHADERPSPSADELWTLHIEGVEASVRELWLMEGRWVGSGEVRGAFRLRPQRSLDVSASTLSLVDGSITLDSVPVLELHSGSIEARVGLFDVRVPRGLEVLRHIDGRVRLRGWVPSVAPTLAVYAGDDGPHVAGGTGSLELDAVIAQGVLARGGRLSIALTELTVRHGDLAVHGPLALRVDVGAPPALELDASSELLDVARSSASARGEAVASVREAGVHSRLALGDLARPRPLRDALEQLSADVGTLQVDELSRLAPFAPPRIVPAGGGATLAARLSFDGGDLSGRADLLLERARVRFDDVELGASGRAWLNAASDDASGAIAFPSSGMDLTDMTFSRGTARTTGMTARVRADDASLVRSGVRDVVATTLRVHAAPGERVLAAVASLASLPRWLARSAAGPDATAEVRLRAARGTTDVRLVDARDGAVRVRGALIDREGDARGAFLVEAGGLRAGVDLRGASGGGPRVAPIADAAWLERQLRALR